MAINKGQAARSAACNRCPRRAGAKGEQPRNRRLMPKGHHEPVKGFGNPLRLRGRFPSIRVKGQGEACEASHGGRARLVRSTKRAHPPWRTEVQSAPETLDVKWRWDERWPKLEGERREHGGSRASEASECKVFRACVCARGRAYKVCYSIMPLFRGFLLYSGWKSHSGITVPLF